MRTCIIASLRDSFLTKEAETALYNGFSGTHFVHKSERRTRDGAFIYALSADETSPALAAPRHAITALFSCRFKCPCPPRRQRHFHGNADRAYNTLHFASQSRVPNGGVAPFGNPHKKRRYATPPRGAYRLFLLSSPPAVSVEQKSAWD